ncbi:DUF2188 domain-containing protein [Steroidobacter sp.]|uniref:DUF2188 domain-containing protein n=1 Tax=Steroidobacter sp. TaxID=1978227 RepID=UPI002ED7AA7B
MSKKTVHTTPNPGGKGWVNKLGGEVVSKHRTQENAADRGREIAREQRTSTQFIAAMEPLAKRTRMGANPLPPRDKNR